MALFRKTEKIEHPSTPQASEELDALRTAIGKVLGANGLTDARLRLTLTNGPIAERVSHCLQVVGHG